MNYGKESIIKERQIKNKKKNEWEKMKVKKESRDTEDSSDVIIL